MVVVGKKECLPLFVHNVCFRQTPLTLLSKRENGRLHDLLCKFLLSVVSLYTANCPKCDHKVTRNDGCHPNAQYELQVTQTLLRSC